MANAFNVKYKDQNFVSNKIFAMAVVPLTYDKKLRLKRKYNELYCSAQGLNSKLLGYE